MVFFKRSTKLMLSVMPIQQSGTYENVEGKCSHLLALAQTIDGDKLTTGALNLWPRATVYSWRNDSIKTRSNELSSDCTKFIKVGCSSWFDKRLAKNHLFVTEIMKLELTKCITSKSVIAYDRQKIIIMIRSAPVSRKSGQNVFKISKPSSSTWKLTHVVYSEGGMVSNSE